MSNDKKKVISLVNELLEFEVLFLDYDRYRSKNHEKFDAIIHANENDIASDNVHYPQTTHPTKTSFWRAFKDIRIIMRDKRTVSVDSLVHYVRKKINTLELDDEYLREHVFNIYSTFRQKNAPKPHYISAKLDQKKFTDIVKTINRMHDKTSCN